MSKVNMVDSNMVKTHMFWNHKVRKHDTNTLIDPSLYKYTVGALQYVILTRPDISYCINNACKCMESSLETHRNMVK